MSGFDKSRWSSRGDLYEREELHCLYMVRRQGALKTHWKYLFREENPQRALAQMELTHWGLDQVE